MKAFTVNYALCLWVVTGSHSFPLFLCYLQLCLYLPCLILVYFPVRWVFNIWTHFNNQIKIYIHCKERNVMWVYFQNKLSRVINFYVKTWSSVEWCRLYVQCYDQEYSISYLRFETPDVLTKAIYAENLSNY